MDAADWKGLQECIQTLGESQRKDIVVTMLGQCRRRCGEAALQSTAIFQGIKNSDQFIVIYDEFAAAETGVNPC